MASVTASCRLQPGLAGATAARMRLVRALVVACTLALFGLPLKAQDATVLEARVKAAFLYKFAAYVEWPAEVHARSPLVIGVIGADEIAHELLQLVTVRPSDARPAMVRRLGVGDATDDLHILFVGRTVARPLDPVLRRAQRDGVLTVTESEEAFAHGSVINFKLVEGRVRFDVSLPAAEQSGLRLSARLLAVAHRVHRAPQ